MLAEMLRAEAASAMETVHFQTAVCASRYKTSTLAKRSSEAGANIDQLIGARRAGFAQLARSTSGIFHINRRRRRPERVSEARQVPHRRNYSAINLPRNNSPPKHTPAPAARRARRLEPSPYAAGQHTGVLTARDLPCGRFLGDSLGTGSHWNINTGWVHSILQTENGPEGGRR
ncbi:hypothetical protein EVAR_22098_1 [Eumeta japonica]|uniref:Uncharacterized protein n=1 Tax=Eumeta variegata TaxID=151549 RepID=A0A4C1USR7_EUMVA|nr:hypothetical protein EVAR_22098_1 [Eumeta japonica]